VYPQSIPPLLTRSGADFEDSVEQGIASRYPTEDFGADGPRGSDRDVSNAAVVTIGRALPPGDTRVLFQPRLLVALNGWLLRGDVDILRLERDAEGRLHVLIADIKSSTSAKVEHRLQVAFYHEMLATLFRQDGVAHEEIEMAVLYRGPAAGDEGLSKDDKARHAAQQAAAVALFNVTDGLLEIVADPQSYRQAVQDLVTGTDSTADRVAAAPFDTVPFHLTTKCDGCLYTEFCMKRSAQQDDLSLIPHLTLQDKAALQRVGISSTRDLASMKELPEAREGEPTPYDLQAVRGQEVLIQRAAATWPVGPRLDELIHRARHYRRLKGDAITALPFIPSKGYGSLPYTDAQHNPNLIRVYIDVQQDYLQDRVYLLGALVAPCEEGIAQPDRRRAIVRVAEGPPDDAQEEALFLSWIDDTIRAIVDLAAPDADGQPRAPIHLIFMTDLAQSLLLDGLGRHARRVFGATPLYDFVTQLAAFDSPVSTILDHDIQELKNYPMVCQSLQAVAAYLKFDWNTPAPYREIFHERLFDFWRKLEGDDRRDPEESAWYTSRARFGSQMPLEYAYAAWGDLETMRRPRQEDAGAAVIEPAAQTPPVSAVAPDYAPYRHATIPLLVGFAERRLDAMEHITSAFKGNKDTEKRAFDLPDLSAFVERAQTLAQALVEFVTVERHVWLGAWKTARLAPPERRVLAGQTLLVRYDPADQEDPDVVERNRDNWRRQALKDQYYAAYRTEHPGARRVMLSKDQKAACAWSPAGLQVRLRLEVAGVDCSLAEAVALSTLREGKRLVVCPRLMVDSRLPVAEQKPLTPTAKRLFYGMRAELVKIDPVVAENGDTVAAYAVVELLPPMGGSDKNGFTFASMDEPLLVEGALYTLDEDPNNPYGAMCLEVAKGLASRRPNTFYQRLTDPTGARVTWSAEAANGQARFLAGLDALHAADAFHTLEESKRAYIGGHGDTPTLLVQGPPGTGKSYATAFALFARLQGAMAADRDLRVFLSCHTHAATDVLLHNVREVQEMLRGWARTHPELSATYFDPRLLQTPLFRAQPKDSQPSGIIVLPKDKERTTGTPTAVETLSATRWLVMGAGPAGIRSVLKDTWPKDLFGHDLCDCLILDEASQMNLPEAAMAALPLKPEGQLIVVGDHRQMPPIVAHDWSTEPRRTVKEFRSYESLFLALLPLGLPMIRFAESFRLHADMAEFLRHEIYQQDGIAYHSHQRNTLPSVAHEDLFVASVLRPEHPLVVIVHDEAHSQVRNPFEQALITPVLEALADPATYGLGPQHGLGVVVPHRAQRAALRESVPALTLRDPATGAIVCSAVDTVERFQGDERTAILVSATESDRAYVLASSEFLLDPRRLTVALSRAKRKMVLVASRSVFTVFSADEETFAQAQLWKNLLRRTCTVKLWEGERDGQYVEVYGNVLAQ